MRRRTPRLRGLGAVGATIFAVGCGGPAGGAGDAALAELEARMTAELEARFTPGLHTLMVTLAHRHASLWFSGAEGNWGLADYMLHELEELIEEIEELHPVYDDIPVAELLSEMTIPAVERLEAAVDAEDGAAFARAFDQLTTACNACHVASGRDYIRMVRPETPPLTNLRYRPNGN
jgi:cytochrome c553